MGSLCYSPRNPYLASAARILFSALSPSFPEQFGRPSTVSASSAAFFPTVLINHISVQLPAQHWRSVDLGIPRNQAVNGCLCTGLFRSAKQPMCAAANVWSYPVAVNLSIWKKRAPGKLHAEWKWESEESGENPRRENTVDLEVKEGVQNSLRGTSCSKVRQTSLRPKDRRPGQCRTRKDTWNL